ncbi:spidroin-1-like [Neofelis nebulosa]|uniref:spidroin-1-like n=1 Tax=Neofelis nebulosa TaxID=61452 RepID=UPI00272B6672|nr:spidroin-1-like [Neofelis nebulosa]
MARAGADALPPLGPGESGGRGAGGSRVEREGEGVGGERRGEETRGEKWSWASRVRQRSPVPGARPGEEEEAEGVEERRRGPVGSGLRGAADGVALAGGGTGTRGRRRRWQAPRGPRRAWAAAGARCALLGLPGAGPLSRLGSAHSALGRAAVPSSAPPLIDWPACAATLGKLGPAGGTQGEGAGGGGGGGPETGGSTQGRDGRKPGSGLGSGAAKSTS